MGVENSLRISTNFIIRLTKVVTFQRASGLKMRGLNQVAVATGHYCSVFCVFSYTTHQMDLQMNQKIRKPIIEKRRRARINKSLAKLLDFLVLNEVCPQPSRIHKYDKADILEMTVDYLRLSKFDSTQFHSHRQGFNHCFNETVSILKALEICDSVISDLKQRLQNKINEIYEQCSCFKEPMGRKTLYASSHQDKENTQPAEQTQTIDAVWRPW